MSRHTIKPGQTRPLGDDFCTILRHVVREGNKSRLIVLFPVTGHTQSLPYNSVLNGVGRDKTRPPRSTKYDFTMTVECLYCKSEFRPSVGAVRSATNKGVLPKYCSIKCRSTDILTSKEQSRRALKGREKARASRLSRTSLNEKGYAKYYGRHVHRIMAEVMMGRPLVAGEVVHHIDGNSHNNFPNNLFVCTRSRHAKIHRQKGKLVAN